MCGLLLLQPEHKVEDGHTPLTLAAKSGFDACAQQLLAAGADVAARTDKGKHMHRNALHWACAGPSTAPASCPRPP